jgi:hypothetical protein
MEACSPTPAPAPRPPSGVMRVEGDGVFFRNPWGPTGNPSGTQTSRSFRVEDRETGLYSMTLEEFRQRVYVLAVPPAGHAMADAA